MDGYTWAKKIASLPDIIRPDKHTRRIEWNKRWEEDLARVYDEKILIYPGLRRTQHTRDAREYEKAASQDMILHIEERTESTMIVQGRVTDRAVWKLLNDDLEGRWKSITDDRRKEIILEAIYRTSCIPGGWEEARKFCPDVTIANLSANQGKLFIDWLKLIISSRRSRIPGSDLQPALFPHHLLDKILEAMDLEVFRRFDLLTRSYLISFVLWYILLAIYGDADLPHAGVHKSAKQVNSLKSAYKAAEKIHGKDFVRSVKKAMKENFVDWKAVNACFYCKKRSEPSTDISLKACARCKEIGRIIRYCSRECQVLDWKKGTARPHKQTCGKPLQLDESFLPKQSLAPEGLPERIPEPAPTFQRSLALEYQVNLVYSSSADYTLVATKDDVNHVQIRFPVEDTFEFTRMSFLIMRYRAFLNGDSGAVNAMFKLCIPILQEKGIPAERLAAQLESEFGVKVPDDEFELSSLSPLTEEEIDWALRVMAVFEVLQEILDECEASIQGEPGTVE